MGALFFRRGVDASTGTQETVRARDRAFNQMTRCSTQLAAHLKLMPEDDANALILPWFSKYLVLRQQLDQATDHFDDLCFEFIRGHAPPEYKAQPFVAAFLDEIKATQT